jgi:predicted Zn-dependent protease with MMP-like domain
VPFDVDRTTFDRLVAQAIASLPEHYRRTVEEDVAVRVADRPTPDQLRELGMDEQELLLGLYEGVALPDQAVEGPPALPPVIWLFREDIEDASEDEQQLIEEVRVTLLHELGHHFGLDEEDLAAVGYD